jgi:hypothetical protein
MTSLDVIASGALHRMPACGRHGVQGGAWQSDIKCHSEPIRFPQGKLREESR